MAYKLVKREILLQELAGEILADLQKNGDGIPRDSLQDHMIGEAGEPGVVFSNWERDRAVLLLIQDGYLQEVHEPHEGLPDWHVLRLVRTPARA